MTRDAVPSEESLTVEFKSDRDILSDDALVEAVVCLANAEGGRVFVGIEDDGRVTGLHPTRPARIEGLAALVANRTSPPLAVRVNEPSSAALVEVVEWLDLLGRGVNTEQEFADGLFRVAVARVDADALREAINNALVHRDYARLGPVRVCWETDQLIVSNAGGFVEGVTLGNLLTTEPSNAAPTTRWQGARCQALEPHKPIWTHLDGFGLANKGQVLDI